MKTKIKKIEAIAITAIMMFSVFAGIMPMIPMAGAYQSGGPVGGYLNDTNTNVSINSSNLVGTDAFNVTYEGMTVGLNFSLNFSMNVTNISLDFSHIGATLPVIGNNTAISDNSANITNVSYPGGWGNDSTSNMVRRITTDSTNDTIEFYNATAGDTPLNNVSNNTILYFSINNVTMPSVGSTTDRYINVSATGGEEGSNVNWTKVWLNITNDEVKPTLTSLVMSTLKDDVVSGPGGIPEVWNQRYNASNPPIVFNLNDTLSGVKNGTIRVYIDDASSVLLNATINEGNVTMDGRNATVDLTNTSRYFDTGTAGNLTAGETHTLNVTVTDNSTNPIGSYYIAETFYVPRIVMGANQTADITADEADTINVTAHLLKPDGSIDTSAGTVKFTSDANVKFEGGTNLYFKDNDAGNVTVNVTFKAKGIHEIKAEFNSTDNEVKISTVAVITGVKAGIDGDLTKTSGILAANASDTCNITLQAVDTSGDPVLRSGYNTTVTAISSIESASVNITTAIKYTDTSGRENRTLTSSDTVDEIVTITPAIKLANGTWVDGNAVTVTFITGNITNMRLYNTTTSEFNANIAFDNIVAGEGITLIANITDDLNHVISGVDVKFALEAGSGTFYGGATSNTTQTDSNGNATAIFSTGTTAKFNASWINVTVPLNTTMFHYIQVNTINGTADHITLTALPQGLPADNSSISTLTAIIVDSNGNNVSNYASVANISFGMSPTNLGNLSASYNLTNATGYAVVNFTTGTTEGEVIITAKANVTLPGVNSTTTTIVLGLPDTIKLTADRTNIPTDGSRNATVTAALYKGAMPIGMEDVNMTFQLTNGTLYEYQNDTWNGSSITVLTNGTGVAAVNVSGSGAVETVTLIVVSPDYSGIDAETMDFTFTGDAIKFTLTNTTPTPPNATGISNSTLIVQLYDEMDNKVGTVPGKTVTFTKTNGTLSQSIGTTNETTGILNVTLSANTTLGPVTSTVTTYISGMTTQSVTVDFPEEAPSCPWDLNGDETVDISDLIILTNHWGEDWSTGDFNNDNTIDISDVIILTSHWGACPT